MPTAYEANPKQHCPLCDRGDYCFLIGDPIELVLCSRTDPNNPPQGWNYVGEAKDHRPKFASQQKRQRKNSKYPELVELQPQDLPDIPQWQPVTPPETLSTGDIVLHCVNGLRIGKFYHITGRVTKRGKQPPLIKVAPIGYERVGATELPEKELEYAIEDPTESAELNQVEYLYPDPYTQKELGKVVRRQWSDRRQWFDKFRKTKEIRPWHWDGKKWQSGKGDRQWPLYRELEAKEAIINGQIVFAVAGEQAVEHYRQLGLVAVTVAGGEAKFVEIADRLQDAFNTAKEAGVKPLLAIHPDFDLTGETKFADGLSLECRKRDIPAVAMDPQHIWLDIPHGGDIFDVVTQSGMSHKEIIMAIEYAIDEAIDHQEKAELLIKQRQRWGAPETYQGELGYWQEDREGFNKFRPLTNFDFQIEKEVASPDGGGFVLQLKRAGENRQFRLFLPSLDFTSVTSFENTLKKALGGALICRLTVNQMKALIRVRLHEYHHNRGGKVFRLADRVGQQADGYWVFPRQQMTPAGEMTDENKSLWIWNSGLTGDEATLPTPHINPPNSDALQNLVNVMTRFFGPKNIYPALLTLGYAAAAVHYQEFIKKDSSFPILNLIGDGGSGKTTAATCALAMVGMHTEAAGGMLRDVSISAAYEHLKITGSLIHCLDDPERTPFLDEFLKGLYNGKARLVRGQNGAAFNMQRPHSPLMVTSNFACGETNAATMSRLIQLWFDCNDKGEATAYREFQKAWDNASGALPDLIKLGHLAEDIELIEQDLIPHLGYAHSRIAKSLAVLVAYTEAVLKLSQVDSFDVRSYAIKSICRMANDADSSTDSLRDFVERLFILRSEAKVGEWNMRFIREHNTEKLRALALNLPSIWAVMDKEFKLPYNQRIIKHLLQGQNANMTARQRFHIDRNVSQNFDRKATDDPRWQIKRCVEIPVEVIKKYVDMDLDTESMSTLSTDLSNEPESLEDKESPQLTTNSQLNVNRKEISQLSNGQPKADVDKNQLSTENPVDSILSTDQTHIEQGLEGDLEPQLTQLTSKGVRTYSPSLADDNSDWKQHKELGTSVRVIRKRRNDSLIYVPGLGEQTVGNNLIEW
ncbi:hypothetical protein [Almyronema epifaneia]|uniref:DUF927 domain-containing protein n=1 Tax=Almyronema epifaneia S1 TaxID=2991925 RepID=A0ABW6ILV6_9CYAN